MEIQELIALLSQVDSALHTIKMEKVTGVLSAKEAKRKCAALIKRMKFDEMVNKAVKEWDENNEQFTISNWQ